MDNPEVGGQRSGVRGRTSEVRGQRSEVRGHQAPGGPLAKVGPSAQAAEGGGELRPWAEPRTDTATERFRRWGRRSSFLSSLRTRLAALVILAMVPVVGVVIFNALQQRRWATELAQAEVLRLVRLAAERQDEQINAARQLLATVALLKEVINQDTQACHWIFAHLRSLSPVYANLGGIALDGHTFASALPVPGPVYLGDRSYFQAVTNHLQFAVGEYQIGRITGKATLNMGYPVTNASGRLCGVVFAALDLEYLKHYVTNFNLPAQSSITVVDRHGVTLVRHPDPQNRFVGQRLPWPSGWSTNRLQRLGATLQRVARTNEATFVTRGRDGVRRLYGVTYLGRSLGVSPGAVIIGIPTAVAYAEANRALWWNLLVLGGVTALALGLAWVGSDVLVLRRVRALVRAADRIRAGDYAVRVGNGEGRGELHVLSRAFDEMAEALQKRIQERQQAEAALVALNQQLEQRVAQRTAQLERSNQELQQFAYVASHDLQEPLRAVSQYLGLLRDRHSAQLPPKAIEFLDFAQQGAARMQELIQALLAYCRVDTQGRPFELTDCNRVLERVRLNLRVALEESGAELTSDPLPRVWADEVQLGQLLQNLISNAIKFRRQEPPKVHIGVRQEGSVWHWTVQDNGLGIPQESLPRLFVIFQRLHNRSQYPGTGIGLAICKKIVERHGGRIWAESQLGTGSTFHFTLPVQPVAPEAAGGGLGLGATKDQRPPNTPQEPPQRGLNSEDQPHLTAGCGP
jgi:signal transduction histidine kinase